MIERDNQEAAPVVEYTVRAACTVCGRPYLLPKGSKAPGGICPRCQPSLLDDALGDGSVHGEPERQPAAEGRETPTPDPSPNAPSRELGHLGLLDVLCEGCRHQPADGRLTPGVALCVDCADEAVEHWLAWLDDPLHDWWPSDDPFASARHSVEGWRAMETA